MRKDVGGGRTVMVVEDDEALRERLCYALDRRGFASTGYATIADATAAAMAEAPELAVIDLRLPDGSGLDLIRSLHQAEPATIIVVLTGYGSIATALEAVQRGATWYLTKPVDIDDVIVAFARGDETLREELELPPFEEAAPPKVQAPSLARLEWEHIQRVLNDCGGNISQAARVLGLHRRSLQRKLAKHPVRR